MGDNSSEKKRFIFLYDCQTEGHNVPALLKFLIIFFLRIILANAEFLLSWVGGP